MEALRVQHNELSKHNLLLTQVIKMEKNAQIIFFLNYECAH